MHEIVTSRTEALQRQCRQRHVRRLEVFGSAVHGEFDAATSDLDFLVVFEPLDPAAHANAYLGLLGDLQDLFEREIDLVEIDAVRNPFFLSSIADHRAVLYAA